MHKKNISIISAGFLLLTSAAVKSEELIITADEMEIGTEAYLTDEAIITSAMFDPDMSMGDIINLVDDTGTNLTVKPTKQAKTKLALFQVKCKKTRCNISGQLKLMYPYGEPELVFEFLGYSSHDETTIQFSLSDIIQKTMGIPVKISGFASYGDSVDSLLLKANMARLSSDRVTVDLTKLSDDNLVEFIENCFETCERLLVTGDLYVSSSQSTLVAKTLVQH